jgi:hypothetical protein
MTVKLSHDRNVRSLAKKTLGSTRVGRAIRLPGGVLVLVVYGQMRVMYHWMFGGVVDWTYLCLFALYLLFYYLRSGSSESNGESG